MSDEIKSKRFYRHGEYNVICDRCGFKFGNHECKLEWNGLFVCKWCLEDKHPSDDPRINKIKPDLTRPTYIRDESDQPLACSVDGSTSVVDVMVAECAVVESDYSFWYVNH